MIFLLGLTALKNRWIAPVTLELLLQRSNCPSHWLLSQRCESFLWSRSHIPETETLLSIWRAVMLTMFSVSLHFGSKPMSTLILLQTLTGGMTPAPTRDLRGQVERAFDWPSSQELVRQRLPLGIMILKTAIHILQTTVSLSRSLCDLRTVHIYQGNLRKLTIARRKYYILIHPKHKEVTSPLSLWSFWTSGSFLRIGPLVQNGVSLQKTILCSIPTFDLYSVLPYCHSGLGTIFSRTFFFIGICFLSTRWFASNLGEYRCTTIIMRIALIFFCLNNEITVTYWGIRETCSVSVVQFLLLHRTPIPV